MTWAVFLLSLVGPIVVRAIIAIGLSVVTVTGMTALVSSLVTAAQGYYGGMPSAILGLAALSGVPAGLGLVFGAFVARAAMWAAMSATRLAFKT